jgi:AcrR family transcriptional regulator
MGTGQTRTPRLPPEERRSQLLDATLHVLAEEGFDAVTVEAVAQAAGVTRPVIYDLFGDLDGLMHALLDREEHQAVDPLLEIIGPPADDVDPEAFLIGAVSAFLLSVKAKPRTWRLILMPPPGNSSDLRVRIQRNRRVVTARVKELLDWGIPRRGGPLGLDHELAAHLTVAAGLDAARLMLAHPRRFPAERLIDGLGGLLMVVPAGPGPRGRPMPEATAVPVRPPLVVKARPGSRMPRAQRTEQLLDAALQLLVTEGFEAVTMESIARAAGVNRVVVYRSFANLQLLLVALLRREDKRTHEALESLIPTEVSGRDAAQLCGEVLAGYLDAVIANPETWRLGLLPPESAPRWLQKAVNRRRTQVARQLTPLVEWGLQSMGLDPAQVDPELLGRLLLTVGLEEARLALDEPAFTRERLATSTWALLDSLPLVV